MSTGSASAKSRFDTPPVDVIITTISTCGWSTKHLDVAHGRRLERRRGDEREQARGLRERLGRLLERGLELAARGREVERERARARLEPLEQDARVEAIPRFGRDSRPRMCADG